MSSHMGGGWQVVWYADGDYLFEHQLTSSADLAEVLRTVRSLQGTGKVGYVVAHVPGLGPVCPVPSPSLRALSVSGYHFWEMSLAEARRACLAGAFTLRAWGLDLAMVAVVMDGCQLKLNPDDIIVYPGVAERSTMGEA